jgi:hypothetical protein
MLGNAEQKLEPNLFDYLGCHSSVTATIRSPHAFKGNAWNNCKERPMRIAKDKEMGPCLERCSDRE